MENPRTFTAIGAEQISEDGRQWIEVMPTADKARNGPFYFTITRDDLEVFAKSIQRNGGKVPIDYDHAGMDGKSTRASGWFTGDAEVRDGDGGPKLWAEVEWTPAAVEAIKSGEYRFLSPEWTHKNRDAKSGLLTKAKDFIAATLTNRPFFRELAPVTASDLTLEDPAVVALAENLGVDAADALALLQTDVPQDVKDRLASASKPDDTPEGDDMTKEVLEALGLAEDASDEQALAAVKELQESLETATGLPREALANFKALAVKGLEADKQLERLRAEQEKRIHDEERDRLLDKAVEEGQILPAHKPALSAIYDLDPKNARAVIESMPKRSFKERGSGERGPDSEPDVRRIVDKQGNTVAALVDSDWLDMRAQEILRASGKTLKTAGQDDYLDAVEQAQAEAAGR